MGLNEHVIDYLPAYALGCLDKDEAKLVRSHLQSCATCRGELSVYQSIVEELPFAAQEHRPPADLKTRILERIQQPESRGVGPRLRAWWDAVIQSYQRIAPAWGLASMVFVLALIVSNYYFWQQAAVAQNLAHDNLQVVALTGTETNPEARGMIVISRDGDHGTLVADGLPVLDEDHQYQLWLIRDGDRVSGGVFSVKEDGYVSMWVGAPDPLGSYSAFGITIEPAGGSPGPTGTKVLGGEL